MLRSEEHRSASFWKGSENEDGAKDAIAERIYYLHRSGKSLERLAVLFGMPEYNVYQLIKYQQKIIDSKDRKERTAKSRKYTAARKAAAKQRLKNWQELHAKVSA